jgi:tetratricopeptide (TPR) repeat protein
MSKPPIIDRKELKHPDAFVTQGRHAIELVVGQQKKILASVVVVAVIGFAFYFYDWNRQKKNVMGWTEFAQINKLPEVERWDKLKKMAEELNSVAVGQFAATTLADHYFEESKKEATAKPGTPSASAALAVEWYTKSLSYTKLSPNEKGLLLINRGEAHEMGQKWDEALVDYTEAVKVGFEGKPLALLGQARVYEFKKEKEKAIEVYEKVAADFLNTEYGRTAKTYLRRLKSPLFSESKS